MSLNHLNVQNTSVKCTGLGRWYLLTAIYVECEDVYGERQLLQDGIAVIGCNSSALEDDALRQKRINQGEGARLERLLFRLKTNAV